jgi:hypothetical protein
MVPSEYKKVFYCPFHHCVLGENKIGNMTQIKDVDLKYPRV